MGSILGRRPEPKRIAVTLAFAAALIGGIAATLKTMQARVSGSYLTLMTTYAATGRYGSSVQVQCRLTDLNGHAVVGDSIHLYLTFPTYTTNLTTSYFEENQPCPNATVC